MRAGAVRCQGRSVREHVQTRVRRQCCAPARRVRMAPQPSPSLRIPQARSAAPRAPRALAHQPRSAPLTVMQISRCDGRSHGPSLKRPVLGLDSPASCSWAKSEIGWSIEVLLLVGLDWSRRCSLGHRRTVRASSSGSRLTSSVLYADDYRVVMDWGTRDRPQAVAVTAPASDL